MLVVLYIHDQIFNLFYIQETSVLFELSRHDFKQISTCRREVKLLKQLWDYMFLVRTCIDDWRTTLWSNIDVENMDMECKKFAKVIFYVFEMVKKLRQYSL